MPKSSLPLSSNQPDLRVLAFLARLQAVALAIVSGLAAATLLYWLVPAVQFLAPLGWRAPKVNCALLMLAACVSLSLSNPRRSAKALRISRLLGISITFVSMQTLAEWIGLPAFHIDTLLASDPLSNHPGRMVSDAALALLLMGVVLANIRARKSVRGHVVDVVSLGMCLLLLLIISGHVLSRLHVVEIPGDHRISGTMAVCLGLLGLAIFNRRAEYSRFSILLGSGIGGKIAEMGAILRTVFRETDVIGRVGGDEFVVAYRGNEAMSEQFAQRLQGAVLASNAAEGRAFTLSFSDGHVSIDSTCGETFEGIVKRADLVMYEAKRLKKTRAARSLELLPA